MTRRLPLLLLALLLLALPAAAQDLSSDTKSESSTMDVLQKLLLGKVKESTTEAATKASGGTAAGGGTAEHLPRKAPGTGAKAEAQPDATPAKPRGLKPQPARQADFHPLPRLKPAAPISGSPTIQPIKPIPMPADGSE